MTVVAFKRTFPDVVEFRTLGPTDNTGLRDEATDPPINYYPPEVYLTFVRPVDGRDLEVVRDEIVQAVHSWVLGIIPDGAQRVLFSLRGPSLPSACVFHERAANGLDRHEVFGYLLVSGIAFWQTSARMLLPGVNNDKIAWSPKAIPRRLKKAET